MNENNTLIREAKNTIEVEGWLKDFNLIEDGEVIRGDVTIVSGENEEHRISVYENKYAKADLKKENPSSAYKGLLTFMETAVSMAKLTSQGADINYAKEQAWKISCTGRYAKLARNEFYDPTGTLVSRQNLVGRYFRQVTADKFNPRAIFNVECFFTSIKEETNREGVKTGRVLVETVIPVYGGKAMPYSFVADGEIGEYLMDNYEINRTSCIHGDIVNTVITETTKHTGFGTPRVEVNHTYVHEFKITGGDESQYPDGDSRAYTVEQIKAAMDVRENTYLPSLLEKSKTRGKNGTSKPAQAGFGTPKTASVAQPTVNKPTFTF